MTDKTPERAAAVERLRQWATTGGGAAHFAWGTPGCFARCQQFYKGKMPGHMVDGWCARLQKRATGRWPGQDNDTNDESRG